MKTSQALGLAHPIARGKADDKEKCLQSVMMTGFLTCSRYEHVFTFETMLVGFQCFHSLALSVGNEPTVPWAGLPSAECYGS